MTFFVFLKKLNQRLSFVLMMFLWVFYFGFGAKDELSILTKERESLTECEDGHFCWTKISQKPLKLSQIQTENLARRVMQKLQLKSLRRKNKFTFFNANSISLEVNFVTHWSESMWGGLIFALLWGSCHVVSPFVQGNVVKLVISLG